ncbi:hypothetical protein WR25_26916 [Diploscapter pachys]|uniref:NAD-dependent epimerase/dehydratase domain-containing protein n=1 Tax=Diploscapter pachys TaxID=2018661 RepID=A0A2A2L817_9BILA|nr:hypothetical protein WR25_26916 [Diploscapter pachys]
MLYPPAASRRRSIAVLGGGSLLGRAVVRAIAEKEKTCFAKVIQLDVNAILAEDEPSLRMLSKADIVVNLVDYQDLRLFPDEKNLAKYNVRAVKQILFFSSSPIIHLSSCLLQCSTRWPNVFEAEADPAKYRSQWPFPEYCESKCIAEEMIKTIGREYCILRCGPIFGADDSSSVLTDLIWMSRFFGGCIPRIGDGEGFLQMTYVENVADIVLKTADKLLANSTAVTPKYYSSTPRCKKPVFLNLSAYSPVKKIDFENVTADESKKAEGEGEQAMDSKLDGSIEVARDSYAAKLREGYQEFSLFGSFDDRDMLNYYESQLQGVLPAILYDSDDDIPGDTFSSGEFYEPLSIVIEETEEEEEESEQWSREEFEESNSELRTEQANPTHCQTLGCSKIERENENEEKDVAADGTEEEFDNDENDEQKAVIRKEIVLVADDTPKGNLFEVFSKVLQGKNGTRSTSLHIPFLPLYLLYFFLTFILQLINTVYPLRDLHRAFSILPHPNVFYLNFRHWTFFNTIKCNLLFGYEYKKSFEEAVATSLPHYNGMEPAHVQRFSWMPQEFNKHSHIKSTS